MAQLEDPANLAPIPEERCRLLFPSLMQTGLRRKDGRLLMLDCVVTTPSMLRICGISTTR
jgi:hypothetical protein